MSASAPDPKLQAAYDRLVKKWARDIRLQLWLSLAAFAVIGFELVRERGRYATAPFWLGSGAMCLASLAYALYGLAMLQRQLKTGLEIDVLRVERVRLMRNRPMNEGPTVRLYVRTESHPRFLLRANARCPLRGMTYARSAKQEAWVALAGRMVRIVHARYLRTALSVELLPDRAGSCRSDLR